MRIKRFKLTDLISIAASVLISFLLVSLTVWGATTISSNINTGGTLDVTGVATFTNGFVSQASSTASNGLTVANSPLQASSTVLLVGGSATSTFTGPISTANRIAILSGTNDVLGLNPPAGSSTSITFDYGGAATSTITKVINSWSVATGTGAVPILSVSGATGGVSINTSNNTVNWGLLGTFDSLLKAEAFGTSDRLAGIVSSRFANDAGYSGNFVGIRGRGNSASPAALQNGDDIAALVALGHDGTDYERAAEILMQVDGGVNSNDMPGRIVFRTTLDGEQNVTERARITNAGFLGIATTSPTSLFSVHGNSYVSGTGFFGSILSSTSSVGVATTSPGGGAEIAAQSSATTTLYLTSSGSGKGACLQLLGTDGSNYRAYATSVSAGALSPLYIELGACE